MLYVYKVHNIRYNVLIPAIKHDKIQYMIMRRKQSNEKKVVIGDLEDGRS